MSKRFHIWQLLLVFCVANFCLVCSVDGQITRWKSTTSGFWADSVNWTDGVPTASDRAFFENNNTYTAVFAANQQALDARVRAGTVTFELDGNSLITQQLYLDGQNANWQVQNGSMTVTDDFVLAELMSQTGNSLLLNSAGFQNKGATGNPLTATIAGAGEADFRVLNSTGLFDRLVIASEKSGNGLLLIGSGGQVNVENSLRIGELGTGRVTVSGGSTLDIQSLAPALETPQPAGIGFGVDAVGTVTVEGSGSEFRWNDTGVAFTQDFIIGDSGTANVTVRSGGRFATIPSSTAPTRGTLIGNAATTKVMFTVEDTGSVADLGQTRLGSGDVDIRVLNGGQLTTESFGGGNTAAIQSILISGSQSRWDTGSLGLRADATVVDGTIVANGAMSLRANLSIDGSTAYVETNRFEPDLAATIEDGYELTVSGGATFRSRGLEIIHGTAKLNGAGSNWILNGDLDVGRSASFPARVELEEGAEINGSSIRSINFNRGSTLQLNDGTISTGFVNITEGQVIGNGTIKANVDTAFGTTMTAIGGTLKLGDLDIAGNSLNLNGDIAVQNEAVVLTNSQISELAGSVTLAGGTLSSVQGIAVSGVGSISGFGTVEGKVFGAANSTIASSGGELIVGDSAEFNGFRTDGAVDVGSGGITIQNRGYAGLGYLTSLSGGVLSATNGVTLASAGNILGSGAIDAKFAGAAGSQIEATGSLVIGNAASFAGFSHQGEILTGGNSLELLDRNQVELGTQTTLGDATTGGTLIALNGAYIDFGTAVTGHGTFFSINDPGSAIVNNGHMQGNSISQRLVLDGFVKGVGTFDNVQFDGTFSPGLSPTCTDGGNFFFGNSSQLELEIGGLARCSEHDAIRATGLLALDGILDVVLINGFDPLLGDSFDLLDWGTLDGQFDAINLPTLTPGLAWNTSGFYSTGVLSVSAVPEPGCVVFINLILIGALANRRRRSF